MRIVKTVNVITITNYYSCGSNTFTSRILDRDADGEVLIVGCSSPVVGILLDGDSISAALKWMTRN